MLVILKEYKSVLAYLMSCFPECLVGFSNKHLSMTVKS